jgi:hypothetical protein
MTVARLTTKLTRLPQLANRDARSLDAYDDPTVFSSGGGCAEAHGNEGGAKQHQPERSDGPDAG